MLSRAGINDSAGVIDETLPLSLLSSPPDTCFSITPDPSSLSISESSASSEDSSSANSTLSEGCFLSDLGSDHLVILFIAPGSSVTSNSKNTSCDAESCKSLSSSVSQW